MKSWLVVLILLWSAPLRAQTQVVALPPTEFNQTFVASATGTCRPVAAGVGYHTIRWTEIGTISAGTVKLQGSTSSDCSSPSDIIAAQAITSSGAVVATAGVWPYVQLVTASYAGAGSTLNVWYGGYKDISSAAVTVGDVTNAGTFAVQCTVGCTGGTSDADDGTVAGGQTTGLAIDLNQVWDGSNWKRMTIGTAGTAAAQVYTVQGVASMTPILATVSDGAGALNVIVDSGTITAVTAITNPVTVTDGAGALNVIVDSGVITTVSTVTTVATLTTITNAVTVTDGAGALNVICDSGCAGGVQYVEDAASAANPTGTSLILLQVDTPADALTSDGDNVAARGNKYGAQYVTLLNQSGAYALSTDSADNAAMSAAPVLMSGGYVAAPADHSDGDAATLMLDIKGRAIVVGQGTAGTAAGGVLTVQGVASMTPVITTIAAGSALIGKVDIQSAGTAIPLVTDPCDGTLKTSFPITITSATTTAVVAASASNKFYLCSINIGPIEAADNIALVEDNDANCSSPTAGIIGGNAAATGWQIAANGGLVLGNGNAMVAVSASTNRHVCIITSSAAEVPGVLTYVLAP